MSGPLAEGLGFTEGPACLPDGTVLFTSIIGNLHSVRDGHVNVAVETGCGPTGLAVDAEGVVYVAACSGIYGAPARVPAGVHRFSGGVFEPFLSEGLSAPNDICIGPDGRLYFTDPTNNEKALFDEAIPGKVLSCDRESGHVQELDGGGFFPNGIAFDSSGEALFVSETFSRRIVRYRFEDGRLNDKSVFAELDDGPDGMAFDADGNLWQCINAADSIEVFNARGELIERFDTGDGSYPSNCCFGGPDYSTLYVTTAGKGGIAAFDAGVRGLPLYPFR